MYTLIQFLLAVALLSSVVIYLPLAEDNMFDGLAIELPTDQLHFHFDRDRTSFTAFKSRYWFQTFLRRLHSDQSIQAVSAIELNNLVAPISLQRCFLKGGFRDFDSFRLQVPAAAQRRLQADQLEVPLEVCRAKSTSSYTIQQ